MDKTDRKTAIEIENSERNFQTPPPNHGPEVDRQDRLNLSPPFQATVDNFFAPKILQNIDLQSTVRIQRVITTDSLQETLRYPRTDTPEPKDNSKIAFDPNLTLKRQQSIKNALQYSFSKGSGYSEEQYSMMSPKDHKDSREIAERDTNTSVGLCDLYLNNNNWEVQVQSHFKKARGSNGTNSSKNEGLSFNYGTFGAEDRAHDRQDTCQSPSLKKYSDNILSDLSYDNIHNNMPTSANNSSNKNDGSYSSYTDGVRPPILLTKNLPLQRNSIGHCTDHASGTPKTQNLPLYDLTNSPTPNPALTQILSKHPDLKTTSD